MILPFYLDSTSAFLSDFLTIELTSLGIKFLASQPFIVKELWSIVNANMHCIFQTEFFTVIRRIMPPLNQGDS
jgi:hypothetical protein